RKATCAAGMGPVVTPSPAAKRSSRNAPSPSQTEAARHYRRSAVKTLLLRGGVDGPLRAFYRLPLLVHHSLVVPVGLLRRGRASRTRVGGSLKRPRPAPAADAFPGGSADLPLEAAGEAVDARACAGHLPGVRPFSPRVGCMRR